jgi:hypothetical protein
VVGTPQPEGQDAFGLPERARQYPRGRKVPNCAGQACGLRIRWIKALSVSMTATVLNSCLRRSWAWKYRWGSTYPQQHKDGRACKSNPTQNRETTAVPVIGNMQHNRL